MIDLIALVAAIALIVVVVMLRAVATMPFARSRASFAPSAVPPAGTEPMFQEAFSALAALGFAAPRWVLVTRVDGAPATLPLRAVLTHPQGGAVWLGPPVAPAGARRLFCYYVDRLEDGRHAISQPFDAFYEATQTDALVARTAAERDFATQWEAHRRWVSGLGSAPRVLGDDEVIDQVTGLVERQRQALIARGALRPVTDDLALPTLRFAARLLRQHRRTPKAPVGSGAVPAELVALLARQQEHVSHRAPARRVQWTLFLSSVALFMAMGALMWGPMFALGLLVVVLIHESGHFLAMRAFGYRNVHMLALPLVGGVAMGVNANPAATRAAWMSLMGPLPGIVIGWALLAAFLLGVLPEAVAGHAFSLALLFLFVNYLNVLPVPPLDGAHVVQALLPPRFARLQTVLLASAALIGALVAWQFGFILLTLLALLQLAGVPALWRLHGAERDLAADSSFVGAHRNVRMLRVARKLERELGPAINAPQRVKQATEVLARLETRPMGALARVGTGAVYAALLIVPLSALFFFQLPQALGLGSEQLERQALEQQQKSQAYRQQAQSVGLKQLLQDLSSETPLAAPADAGSVAALETRLERPLPAELRELYRLSDGVAAIELRALSGIEPAARVMQEIAEFSDTLYVGYQDGEEYRDAELPLTAMQGWWRLGGHDEAPLFYLPEPDARLPGMRVVSDIHESPMAYPSLRAWLEQRWISAQEERDATALNAVRSKRAFESLRDASLEDLAEVFESQSLLETLLVDRPEWPQGATDDVLTTHAHRMQLELPSDYAGFLHLHDGFPPLQLLPIGELARWSERAERIKPELRAVLFEADADAYAPAQSGRTLEGVTEASVQNCLIAAAMPPKGAAGTLWPSLLWCPAATDDSRWIDLSLHRSFPSFRAWLVERAVPFAASREAN